MSETKIEVKAMFTTAGSVVMMLGAVVVMTFFENN